jgi:hypothetical protein
MMSASLENFGAVGRLLFAPFRSFLYVELPYARKSTLSSTKNGILADWLGGGTIEPHPMIRKHLPGMQGRIIWIN